MKKTFLIIGDEPDILALITKFMMLGDFETVICSNAKEASRVIKERYNDIAIILLDPMMSGLNTEKFLQFVKSNERYKHILVKFFPVIKSKELIERIKSIIKNESINELTIQRQYLPEIFGADLLEISNDDGLPVLKPFASLYLSSKGISSNILGNIIKLKKTKPIDFSKLVAPELKIYQTPKERGEIKYYNRDFKHIDPKLRDEIQSFLNWIKDSEGLAAYINNSLQQNNPEVISKLSRIYNELIQILGIQKTGKILPQEKVPKDKVPKTTRILKYKINEYITLKLEHGRTHIYINGKRFLQCIRLFLQIPPQTRHLYDEVESIDEATEVYNKYLWENRIVEGPMALPSRFQNTTITPEQEFWGHCSNLQTWVEHNYDTRLLMSNTAFPLLKKLTEVGDPIAKKVFKEEIAQRLESGYPSVVEYLLIQGYMNYFTPFEFKTMIDTTNLIKNVSAQVKLLSSFLQTCANKFPTILGDIVLKILELPEGKDNLITASSRKSWIFGFTIPLGSNPPILDKIKDTLMDKLKIVRKEKKRDILDYIQVIDSNKRIDVELLKGYHQEGDKLLTQIFKSRKNIRKLKSKLLELGKRYKKGENVSDLRGEAGEVKTLLHLTRIQKRKANLEFKTISEDILIHESDREYWDEWNSHYRCQKNLKPSCEECLDVEKCKRDYKYSMLEYQLKRRRKGEISLEFEIWFLQEIKKIDLDTIPSDNFKLIKYLS